MTLFGKIQQTVLRVMHISSLKSTGIAYHLKKDKLFYCTPWGVNVLIKEWSALFSVSNTLSYQMVTHPRMTGNALEKGQAPLVKLALVSVVLQGGGKWACLPTRLP